MATRRDRILQPNPYKKIPDEAPKTSQELERIEEKILDSTHDVEAKIRDLMAEVDNQVSRTWSEARLDERLFNEKVLNALGQIHRVVHDADWLVHCAVTGRDMMVKKTAETAARADRARQEEVMGALDRIIKTQSHTDAGVNSLNSMMHTVIQNTSTAPAQSRDTTVTHTRAPGASDLRGQASYGGNAKSSIWVWFTNAKLFVSFAAGAGALWVVIVVFAWAMAWGRPIVAALIG